MKTQNGRKINTQVSAERRGRPVPAILSSFGDCCGRFAFFVPIFVSRLADGGGYLPRLAGRGRSEFSGAGWGRAPKFSRAGFFDIPRAITSGAFAIVGNALTAPHDVLSEMPAEN